MSQEEANQRDEVYNRRNAWQKSRFPGRHSMLARRGGEFGDEWIAARDDVLTAVLAKKLIFLIGGRGTGKTQLAASVAFTACIRHGVCPRYYRIADLVGEFKHEVYSEHQREVGFLESLSRIGLIVIDELQDRHETPTEDLFLARLLDYRYGNIMPTIVISNLNPDALCEMMGPGVMSRAEETGVIFECAWQNYRQERAR